MENGIFCHCCNISTNYKRWCEFFRYHLKVKHSEYNFTEKLYYDYYHKKENEGKCVLCKSDTRFNDIFQGYSKYCSRKCINSDPKIKELQISKRKEYFESLSNDEKDNRSKKLKEAWKNRDVESMTSKIKNTKSEKYGDEKYNNVEKIKETIKNRTEEEKTNISNKLKLEIANRSEELTNEIRRKQLISVNETFDKHKDEIIEKRRMTNLERYGDKNYTNPKKRSDTVKQKNYKN